MGKEAPIIVKYIEGGIILSLIGYIVFSLSLNETPVDFSKTGFGTKNSFLLIMTSVMLILGYPFFVVLNLGIRLILSIYVAIIDIISSTFGVGFITSIGSLVEKAFNLLLDLIIQINDWILNLIYFYFSIVIDKGLLYFSISPLPIKIAMLIGLLSGIFVIGNSIIAIFGLKSLDDISYIRLLHIL